MSKLFRIVGFASLALLSALALVSCGSTRSLVYMQGTFDTAQLSKIDIPEPIVRKGDLLSIVVYSDNPQATALYNQSLITVGSSSSGESSSQGSSSLSGSSASVTSAGYLVDGNGDIQFQGLGRLHLEGLTVSQVRDTLDSRLRLVLKNPYYNIRFLNYRFTMLGEVNKPGIYSIPGESMSILEAIGMAGDLTFFARRNNVLIIRENNGKREFGRLDLTKPQIMASPYFYLQQNDMVIVEPNKKRIAASDVATTRNITIAVSVLSLVVILVTLFK
ncbi:MAG TPA: polysaccharide biosynthesis/export family protein [Puia sp.]|nr:polysaccharide biosynthesis/export family protein [Puia sp.]